MNYWKNWAKAACIRAIKTFAHDGSILVNGRKYNIPQYGNFTHNTNDVVKVFVPQGNMSVAFYI